MKTPSAVGAILLLSCVPAYGASSIEVREVGQGPALVFLPAVGCPGELWDGVVGKLASDHACFVVTLACHGAPCPGTTFDSQRVVADLVDFVQEQAMARPALIGHSFGGYLALRLAASHPDVFARLVIVDAQPFPLAFVDPHATADQAAEQAAMLRAIVEKQDDAGFERQQTALLQSSVTDPLRVEQIVRWQVHSDRRALAGSMAEMIATDMRDSIAAIDIPTLVLGTWKAAEPYGMTAALARERFASQYAKVPHCTIVISDRARHFLMFDDPDWLVGQLRGFVDNGR